MSSDIRLFISAIYSSGGYFRSSVILWEYYHNFVGHNKIIKSPNIFEKKKCEPHTLRAHYLVRPSIIMH